MHVSRQTIVHARPEQISTDLAGETVILDANAGRYFGLNPVGSWIWSFIQEPRTVDEIVAGLMVEFDVDEERCEQDVTALLRDLHDNQLVELQEAGAAGARNGRDG